MIPRRAWAVYGVASFWAVTGALAGNSMDQALGQVCVFAALTMIVCRFGEWLDASTQA